ncbi:MAG: HDOD domain-containing protein [Kineosporiaceae bacterium]|nr:HDOD domain-containing protein [Kineosporiaceae bacterium]
MSAHLVEPPRSDLVRRTRVGRQAIYDAERHVAAYEMLFHAGASGGEEVAGEQATSQLIATTFGTFGLEAIADGRPVFINFTRAFLTGVIPIPVEPENVVVELVDTLAVDHELLLGLRTLKDAGYRLALKGYRGEAAHGMLIDLADFVAIDVAGITGPALSEAVAQARSGGATLLATDIENAATLNSCVALGFELFQGSHLQRPSVLEGRTLSPLQLVCVRLLNSLGDPDVPIESIEQMVGSDPGLTLRLLRTANSASHGLAAEIASLHQAIVLLGPRRLRSWVVLTLLEGGAARGRSDDLWSVLARAFACKRLASHEGDLAYTVGLLSGCADLLGGDPAEVAAGAGIGAQARAALLDGDGEAGRALTAVLAHEQDDMDAIAATGFMPFDVSRAYLESLSESLTVVHGLTQS